MMPASLPKPGRRTEWSHLGYRCWTPAVWHPKPASRHTQGADPCAPSSTHSRRGSSCHTSRGRESSQAANGPLANPNPAGGEMRGCARPAIPAKLDIWEGACWAPGKATATRTASITRPRHKQQLLRSRAEWLWGSSFGATRRGALGAVSGQRPSSHPHFAIMAPPWFSRSQRVPAILWIWAGQAGPFQYCREGKATHRNSLPVAPPPFREFIYFSPPCKDEVCSEPPALLFL